MQSNETYFEKLNQWGKEGIPFLFVIDFEQKKPLAFPLTELPENVFFEVPGKKTVQPDMEELPDAIEFNPKFPKFEDYNNRFQKVQNCLNHGDTYLLNLTMPAEIKTNLNLKQIYSHSKSMFRLLYKNMFVCFSPEIFVRIQDGKISSYPMKGTIDAKVENAEKRILDSPKEFAEHNTIVDLIRNDLSIVAKKVRVKRFRYVDRVCTNRGELLQISSEIEGELETNYPARIGTIISKLIPAGSICGAPKLMTVNSILEIEQYDRSYYTGIFGVFDGRNLESAVMIRYIENQNGRLVFKAGGGITAMSNVKEEYEELCNKVYVPFTGNHKN